MRNPIRINCLEFLDNASVAKSPLLLGRDIQKDSTHSHSPLSVTELQGSAPSPLSPFPVSLLTLRGNPCQTQGHVCLFRAFLILCSGMHVQPESSALSIIACSQLPAPHCTMLLASWLLFQVWGHTQQCSLLTPDSTEGHFWW